MQIIRQSAEHHFLTTLERLKENGQGWLTQYYAFSKFVKHADIVAKPQKIPQYLDQITARAETFLVKLEADLAGIEQGYIYLFSDCDIVVLVHADTTEAKNMIRGVYKTHSGEMPQQFSDSGILTSEFYNYQKLADQKLVAAKRFDAYHLMSDTNKIKSIPVRRARREHPKVMIVEDDRFTASYTSNILSKEYDLIISRTGEEGICDYIEHAPDIVFLDIHLPGLSGHEVLAAINAVDPKAFVVMLSVDSAQKNIKMAAETGAQNFLKKPFSKERLLSVVRNSPYVRAFISGGVIH